MEDTCEERGTAPCSGLAPGCVRVCVLGEAVRPLLSGGGGKPAESAESELGLSTLAGFKSASEYNRVGLHPLRLAT
jgi:hypothetical protein